MTITKLFFHFAFKSSKYLKNYNYWCKFNNLICLEECQIYQFEKKIHECIIINTIINDINKYTKKGKGLFLYQHIALFQLRHRKN